MLGRDVQRGLEERATLLCPGRPPLFFKFRNHCFTDVGQLISSQGDLSSSLQKETKARCAPTMCGSESRSDGKLNCKAPKACYYTRPLHGPLNFPRTNAPQCEVNEALGGAVLEPATQETTLSSFPTGTPNATRATTTTLRRPPGPDRKSVV